jgi:hypothetical protein
MKTLVLCLTFSTGFSAAAQEIRQEYIDLLRTDIRAKTSQMVTQMLGLPEPESAKFQPIYREYETEMAKLWDERIWLMKSFDKDWETLDIAKSDMYARKALAWEKSRVALKEKYHKRIEKAMSNMTGARWLQIENQMNTAIDYQLLGSLPLIRQR